MLRAWFHKMGHFFGGKHTPCNGKNKQCVEMLRLIIDGQATTEQIDAFKKHLNECGPCYSKYCLDMAIKDKVQCRCKQEMPRELVEQVKEKLRQAEQQQP